MSNLCLAILYHYNRLHRVNMSQHGCIRIRSITCVYTKCYVHIRVYIHLIRYRSNTNLITYVMYERNYFTITYYRLTYCYLNKWYSDTNVCLGIYSCG